MYDVAVVEQNSFGKVTHFGSIVQGAVADHGSCDPLSDYPDQ